MNNINPTSLQYQIEFMELFTSFVKDTTLMAIIASLKELQAIKLKENVEANK